MPAKKNNRKQNKSSHNTETQNTTPPAVVEEQTPAVAEEATVEPVVVVADTTAPAPTVAVELEEKNKKEAAPAEDTTKKVPSKPPTPPPPPQPDAQEDSGLLAAAVTLESPTTILVNKAYKVKNTGNAIDVTSNATNYGSITFEGTQSEASTEASMRDRIEGETRREAIMEFLHLFLVNAATWGIWNTLDLAVLLTMAAFLASGDVFAGVATAMTITSLTALSVSNGMSSALETLISNAHGADRCSPLIPRYLRASLLVNVSLFIPMALTFVLIPYSWLVVIFPHGNALMLGGMQTWLRMSPFVILPQILSACLQKFVVCQRRPEVVTRSASLSVILLPILLYYATLHASPIAYATAIAVDKSVLLVAMLVSILFDNHLRGNLYVHSNYEGYEEVGNDPEDENEMVSASATQIAIANREILSKPVSFYVKQYIQCGYPSAIAFCIDTWTFELMTLLSARCGPTEVAAWVLMQQLTHPIFATANGLASAAATDVGNAYGANCRVETVFKKVRIAAGTAVIVGMCGGALLFTLGPRVFPFMIHNSKESNNVELRGEEDQYSAEEAMAIGAYNIPIFAMQVSFDIPFYTMQGIYRGLNKQTLSAKIVFIALWTLAVPIAFFWPASWGGCVRGIVSALFVGSSTGAILLYRYIVQHLELLQHHQRREDANREVRA